MAAVSRPSQRRLPGRGPHAGTPACRPAGWKGPSLGSAGPDPLLRLPPDPGSRPFLLAYIRWPFQAGSTSDDLIYLVPSGRPLGRSSTVTRNDALDVSSVCATTQHAWKYPSNLVLLKTRPESCAILSRLSKLSRCCARLLSQYCCEARLWDHAAFKRLKKKN